MGFIERLRFFTTPARQSPPNNGPQTFLYHIGYSKKTCQEVPRGFLLLNNSDSTRSDWREYWPIRNFLNNEPLSDDCFYGFFSPRFKEKTGLTHVQVATFIQSVEPDTDLISFSPQPDMGAFFLNVFEQEEYLNPGFLACSEEFFAAIGMPLDLKSLLMDSRQIIFSNYFAAKPKFWREWLALNEKLFAICEGAESPLKRSLTYSTSYPGAVQRKVFLMERTASVLLTLNRSWKVRSYNTFKMPWSTNALSKFPFEAVVSDALKIAMKEQGFHHYKDAFETLRTMTRS